MFNRALAGRSEAGTLRIQLLPSKDARRHLDVCHLGGAAGTNSQGTLKFCIIDRSIIGDWRGSLEHDVKADACLLENQCRNSFFPIVRDSIWKQVFLIGCGGGVIYKKETKTFHKTLNCSAN